ncbi:MAG TPA: Ig-like domain-containing protein, partial [Vicinamibacteria bacterium]
VFALPLDGERDVPPDSGFKVQFSRDMDEESFKGRVLFRYAGRTQPGDNALDALRVSYDAGLRTLQVDPGDILRPGRIVELILLPGIVDLDGLPLETRPGKNPGQAADVLRFQVAGGGLLSGP